MTLRRLVPARLLGLVAALVLVSCTLQTEPVGGPLGVQPTMQADDLVDLKVYFRSGEGSSAYLVGITKEVAITDDLPRQAVELLIAGPAEDDGPDLSAPLPPATQVRDLVVTDGTAHLDLSHEVISRAEEANPSPEHEALALAAVVGTLTEFPTIERVRLSVEGRQSGRRRGLDVASFWGGWGLPEVLVRDESVMSEPAEGDGVPDLARFSSGDQTLGASPAGAVAVTNVRVRDRTTYMRVMVEFAAVGDPDAPASVPPARAHLEGDQVVLEIDEITSWEADFEPGQRLEVDDPAFEGVAIEATDRSEQVRIVVHPSRTQEFLLHDLSSPTRIVLDVRK